MTLFNKKFNKKVAPMRSGISKQELERYLSMWLMSEERKEMLRGELYYEGYHDILNRERAVIGGSGTLEVVNNLPNHKIVDNQYKMLVDKKINYGLGKPLTIATDNEKYATELNKIFNRRMMKKIRSLGEDSVNHGIAWLHPYYNEFGDFCFKVFKGYEILPIWADEEHEYLRCAIRYFTVEDPTPNSHNYVSRVEVYTPQGVERYDCDKNGVLYADKLVPHYNYIKFDEQEMNWNRVPLIPFKYNDDEIPLIRDTKQLQDAINLIMSNFINNMDEDPRNTLLILKNFNLSPKPSIYFSPFPI